MFKKTLAGLLAGLIAIVSIPTMVQAHIIKNGTDELYYYYGLLPANVQTYLENNNVNIIIDGNQMQRVVVVGDHNDMIRAENVGLTKQYIDSYGIVRSSAIYLKEGYESELLHEVGHVLSNYRGNYNTWAETAAWKYIYECEAPYLLMDEYSKSSPSEYLAESFSWCIQYPDYMAQKAPMTWQYINAMIERT